MYWIESEKRPRGFETSGDERATVAGHSSRRRCCRAPWLLRMEVSKIIILAVVATGDGTGDSKWCEGGLVWSNSMVHVVHRTQKRVFSRELLASFSPS